jgi:hypothetical protein
MDTSGREATLAEEELGPPSSAFEVLEDSPPTPSRKVSIFSMVGRRPVAVKVDGEADLSVFMAERPFNASGAA